MAQIILNLGHHGCITGRFYPSIHTLHILSFMKIILSPFLGKISKKSHDFLNRLIFRSKSENFLNSKYFIV